ncbi:hypothetical protein K502DRAFT_326546 [Neoconidiobolus thromboides FSU 785]|nr:hypothetical protein K502DRAFT_326546 [Neoconidiobolus thromboides FSU 785]
MMGILLADQDGLLSKELLEKKEFTNLEQFHLFFCIILNKYIHELSNGNDNNNNTNEMKENVINNHSLQFYDHKIIDRLENAF